MVNITLQIGLAVLQLLNCSLIPCNLTDDFRRVNLLPDFRLNIRCKFRVANQLPGVLDYFCLYPLSKDGVPAAMTILGDRLMPTGLVQIFFHTAFSLYILLSGVHGTPALGAF